MAEWLTLLTLDHAVTGPSSTWRRDVARTYMGLHCKGGGLVVLLCWVNFQCRGVLLIRIRVGQGPTALAVGVGGVVWTFFPSSIISLFFLTRSGRRPDTD